MINQGLGPGSQMGSASYSRIIEATGDKLSAAYQRRRYATLFYSLALTLSWGPVVLLLHLSGRLIELLLALNLLAAILPISRKKGRYVLFTLIVIAGLLRAPLVLQRIPALNAMNTLIWTAIAMFSTVMALRFAMSGSVISAEHIYASLSAYILAGVFVGVLYSGLEHAWPGSFAITGQPVQGLLLPSTAIYFSFVTLATLGYGDVVPLSEAARGMVVFEAIAGQLYLAVMVARLVSLYVVGERNHAQ